MYRILNVNCISVSYHTPDPSIKNSEQLFSRTGRACSKIGTSLTPTPSTWSTCWWTPSRRLSGLCRVSPMMSCPFKMLQLSLKLKVFRCWLIHRVRVKSGSKQKNSTMTCKLLHSITNTSGNIISKSHLSTKQPILKICMPEILNRKQNIHRLDYFKLSFKYRRSTKMQITHLRTKRNWRCIFY